MLERARSGRSAQLDRVFQALAHPVRRKILAEIGERERSISELSAPFSMSLEAVSQHVRVLERAKLLKRRRSGRVHRCRLNPEPLRDAGQVLQRLAGFWDAQLSSLDRWLEADPKPDKPAKERA